MAEDVILQVRLRPGKDDDLTEWYLAQPDRSAAVRAALRMHLQSDETPEANPLRDLPGLITTAIQAALKGMQLSPAAPTSDTDHREDPTLAARLDDQLDGFWEG